MLNDLAKAMRALDGKKDIEHHKIHSQFTCPMDNRELSHACVVALHKTLSF